MTGIFFKSWDIYSETEDGEYYDRIVNVYQCSSFYVASSTHFELPDRKHFWSNVEQYW